MFFAITETRLSDSDIQHFAFSFLQGITKNCSTPFSTTHVKSCTLQKTLKMNVANWLPAVKCLWATLSWELQRNQQVNI